MNLCEQAEELRLLLEMGLVAKQDLITWADRLIEAESGLPGWLFEISLSANDHTHVLLEKLRDLPCDGSFSLAAHHALRRFAEAFKSGKLSPLQAARMLELWAGTARINSQDSHQAMMPSFIADDAMHGIFDENDVAEAIDKCLIYFAA